MTKFTIAAAAAVMATASVALYMASPALAEQMDRSAGKTITWAEAKTKADTMWTELDVNKDAKIDKADREAKMAERFAKIDTDKNGSISQTEFSAHHSMMKGPGEMAGGQKDGPREGWKGRGKGRMGHHGMMGGGMHMLALADTNKDSMVSRAEYDAAVKMHFDKADANKDGKVTPEERRAAMKEMRAKMGQMGGPGAMGDGPPPPPPAG